MRTRLSVLLSAAALALLLAACGAQKQEGLLVYRATMPDGSTPPFELLDRVSTKM